MERWLIISVLIGMVALAIWGINTASYQAKEDRQSENVDSQFVKTFQRQNFLGNQTTQEILNQTRDIDKLLTERTPKFDAIIENQKIIIHNEAQFGKALNVSGISNETHENGKISSFIGQPVEILNSTQ